MKKLSAQARRKIALKAIRTMRKKYGPNGISKMAKKAWRTRRGR